MGKGGGCKKNLASATDAILKGAARGVGLKVSCVILLDLHVFSKDRLINIKLMVLFPQETISPCRKLDAVTGMIMLPDRPPG